MCLSVKSVAGHLVGLAGVGHLALPDVQRRLVDHGGDHQVHVDLVEESELEVLLFLIL